MSAPASFARRVCGLFLASTALLPAMAAAQDTAAGEQPAPPPVQERQNEGDEIVVTATKRAEALQDVPIAITAFATKTLEDNQVQSFDDYSKMIPSLSQQNVGPGATNVYFRGVASGENANHSTSTSSTSPASRRWQDRKALSMALRARPEPSASSPTSPIPAAPTARSVSR